MTPISTSLITPMPATWHSGNIISETSAPTGVVLWIIQLLIDVSRLRWLSIAPFGMPGRAARVDQPRQVVLADRDVRLARRMPRPTSSS